METLDVVAARRLALVRAGLLRPAWTGLPERAAGRGARARRAALEIIRRFGYLQLDTVSVAGARSHCIVLHSRLAGLDAELGEALLRPGEPLFEYWGHEACWLPVELYPVFAFRRRAFRRHPWWGDLIGSHPRVARDLRRRIRDEGPLRSVDLEGKGSRGWWDLKVAKKVAIALWSSGELAIRERKSFQRSYDLAERVIPGEQYRARPLRRSAAVEHLLLLALQGHGWAQTGTLARTWRLTNMAKEISAAMARLRRSGRAVECTVQNDGRRVRGWIRPEDLELAARLPSLRLPEDRGVLLSPFDPLLWDRARVQLLFRFDQVLEIFKPEPKRKYGYYCMPVLAGDRLVARFDLKSERKAGRLRVVSSRLEDGARGADREAARVALERYAGSVGLDAPAWS
jgi:uncharacterized protein YcaQ